jgi:predicted Rossmann fold nucleotide-binding protein DprA/Smf involved in DNA uptake
MKKLKNQLAGVAKELAKLTQKVQALIGEVESLPAAPKPPAKAKAAAPKGKVAAKNPKKASAKTAAAVAKSDTVLDSVFDVVRRSRNGATIAKLKEKTGLTPRQLSNALYKLSTRGKIVAKSRGLYIKK